MYCSLVNGTFILNHKEPDLGTVTLSAMVSLLEKQDAQQMRIAGKPVGGAYPVIFMI